MRSPNADPSRPGPFNATEIARMRADIDERRAPGAYRPGHWSVSPLNRDPEVAGPVPDRVRLRDTTLRSFRRLPGLYATREAMLAFVRRLAATGVPSVVATPVAGRADEDVREDVAVIRDTNPECVVVCPFAPARDQIDVAARAGYDAIQIPVSGGGSTSLIYQPSIYPMAWRGEDWRPSNPVPERGDGLGRTLDTIAYARERGLRVIATKMMISFTTPEELAEVVPPLVAAGAEEITLFDGPGGVGPEAYARLVREVRIAAPGVEVGLHPHNTFGLAVGCAVAAAGAGATTVEVSVNGYCGGPGNADIAVVAAAFEAVYGVRTGLRLDALTGLARAAEELTGQRVAFNHPVTGPAAFCWGGGDWVSNEVAVDPLLHNSLEPAVVGNERWLPVTPESGPYTMAATLRRLGLPVAAADVPSILRRCQERSAALRRLLTDDEIRQVAAC